MLLVLTLKNGLLPLLHPLWTLVAFQLTLFHLVHHYLLNPALLLLIGHNRGDGRMVHACVGIR